jgi:hypothetical protein
MKSSEVVYDIELRFIRCPVCGLGFAIKQPNSKAVVQAVEAAIAHAGERHDQTDARHHPGGTCGVPYLQSSRMDHRQGN